MNQNWLVSLEIWKMPTGWSLDGDASETTYDIRDLDNSADRDKIFYKSRWIKEKSTIRTENGGTKTIEIEQQLIVSYSIKYRDYLRSIRNGQIERARKMVENGETSTGRKRPNDPKRFIKTDHATADGEAADVSASYIDQAAIDNEEQYDGFYAVCTNLDDDVKNIVKVNQRRWEIEECFRIMKSDFEARPVYVKRQDRILAHFITCFIALIVYRYLEKKLGNKYTITEILSTLQKMEVLRLILCRLLWLRADIRCPSLLWDCSRPRRL